MDEDGFIQQPELWDDHLALALARTDGVAELTDAHWKIIHYIRDYFHEFEIAPMIRKLCKETGFSLREIYDLFPFGTGQGRLQSGGTAETDGLRVVATPDLPGASQLRPSEEQCCSSS